MSTSFTSEALREFLCPAPGGRNLPVPSARAQPGSVQSGAQGASAPGLRKLLVPVDFSPGSFRAVHWAGCVAREAGGSLTLLHVVKPPRPLPFRRETGAVVEELKHRALAQLREWEVSGISRGRRGEILIRSGDPVREIAQAARALKPDLTVVLARPRRGVQQLLGRGVGEDLARLECGPVLSVREELLEDFGGEAWPGGACFWNHLLVPVDLEAGTAAALCTAAALADLFRSRIVLFPLFSADRMKRSSNPFRDYRAAFDRELSGVLAAESGRGRAEVLPEMGVPSADAIIRTATNTRSSLIVLGLGETQKRFAGQLLGAAPCPVLTVPPEHAVSRNGPVEAGVEEVKNLAGSGAGH